MNDNFIIIQESPPFPGFYYKENAAFTRSTSPNEQDNPSFPHQSDIQCHGFEQNLFSQQLWLIVLLIFIKTRLYSKSTFPLKHFKCNINIVYTAQTESSKTKISLFGMKNIPLAISFIS